MSSSTSLTPPPPTSSPFRPIALTAARQSFDHDVTSSRGTLAARDDTSGAAGSSNRTLSKRPLSPSQPRPTSPRKRVRNGTPIVLHSATAASSHPDFCPDTDRQVSNGPPASASTSGYAFATTTAGPSSYAARAISKHAAEAGGGTSEGGEEGSVLFSEQDGIQASGSTVIKGNMDDYIPQPYAAGLSGEGAETDATGEYMEDEENENDGEDRDGDVEDPEGDQVEEEDDGEEDKEGGGEGMEMDESHDRNDGDEGSDGDEDDPNDTTLDGTNHVNESGASRRADQHLASGRRSGGPANATAAHLGGAVDVMHDRDPCGQDLVEAEASSSYHSGDTDLYEMDHRPVLERTAIKRDICKFTGSLARFVDENTGEAIYKVVDRLGEGTFSSVYLAHDRFFHYYDNHSWTGVVDDLEVDEIEPSRSRVPVALKKILVTSSPARIENELAILEHLRGCRNVSKLVTAFREHDQVIIVMPYEQSDDFRHFYRHMDTAAMRDYMKCLMRALKDVHRRGIIHRDVKPANFLYNYADARGVLCDFGLAERYVPPAKIFCQHAPATIHCLHGKRTKTSDTAVAEQAVYDARKRSRLPEKEIGFAKEDKRPQIKTNRAGTRGFRAPEVLLKCPDQTVSIDIWSAGVILLSILTHKFPVFNSNDDTEALLEIAAIFGRAAMEKCALLHNRTILTNIPSVDNTPEKLTPVILRLNPHIYTPPLPNPSPEEARQHIEAIDQAIDLCSRMLRLDTTKRITAANALKHDFLAPQVEEADGWSDLEDDGVLDPTEGKCGYLHSCQDGKHKAYLGNRLVDLHFGQGIPPSRTRLCPEHEHWEQRTGHNIFVISEKFDRPEADERDQDEIEVEDPQDEDERRHAAWPSRDTSSHPVGGKLGSRVRVDRERTLVERDINGGSGLVPTKNAAARAGK